MVERVILIGHVKSGETTNEIIKSICFVNLCHVVLYLQWWNINYEYLLLTQWQLNKSIRAAHIVGF